MRWLALALGLVTPACDVVFDLHRPPEVGPNVVTASYHRRIVRNDPITLLPVVDSILVEMPTPSVTLADGTQPRLTVETDGSITFERAAADQAYRLSLTGADGVPIEYDQAAETLVVGESLIGRADRLPPGGIQYMQTHPGAPTDGDAYLVTTGQWSETKGATTTAFTFAWSNAGLMQGQVGQPGLLKASLGDRAYGAFHGRRIAMPPPPMAPRDYRVVTEFCESLPQPEMTTSNVSTTCTFVPLALDRCAHVAVGWVAEDTRIIAALGARSDLGMASPFYAWGLLAAPSLEVMREVGFLLAYDSWYATTPTDWNADITYANPFLGHSPVLGMRITRARTYKLPDHFQTSYTQAVVHAIAPPACGTATAVPALIGLPGTARFDDVDLTKDDTPITLDRSRDTTVSWSLAAPGSVDYYVVTLIELTDGILGGTVLTPRHQYVTLATSIALAEQHLAKGSTYFIDVQALLGFPDAATGDLVTRGLDQPSGVVNIPSATFTIEN